MRTVRVELGERSYDIVIGDGLLGNAGPWLRELGLKGTGIVVSDATVGQLYGPRVISSLKDAGFNAALYTMPAGEEHKNLDEVRKIYSEMLKLGLDRGSFAISLGGGVVSDITGFAAATFVRGIHFIQIPTSLLAQVDASVGGKVGVNLPQGKNLIGSFYQPRGVLIDPSVLTTLARRQLSSGFAEVIKHAVIRDAAHFDFLEKNFTRALSLDAPCLEKIIGRSCEIKSEIVARDEREGGVRMTLNFGHTIGHALETVTGYRSYTHGEAVAIGMAHAAAIAARYAFLSREDYHRIVRLIESFGLPVRMEGVSAADILAAMRRDKKMRDGQVNFVLPRRIGEVFVTDEVSEDAVREAIEQHVAD